MQMNISYKNSKRPPRVQLGARCWWSLWPRGRRDWTNHSGP